LEAKTDENLFTLDVAPTHSDGTVGDDTVNTIDVITLLKLAAGRLR
jgi:hypothetical protein